MPKPTSKWKKGRGKLGFMAPLLGSWEASAESPMGSVKCTRVFEKTLGDNYIELVAKWDFGGKVYVEQAIYGVNREGEVTFWSFTSDGKNSMGHVTDVTDLHTEAIGFEAEMPAGTARFAMWPDEEDGHFWVVESKTKKGWNRFVTHHYHPTVPES